MQIVYFIRCENTVKIGTTAKPIGLRHASLQAANPRRLVLLKTLCGGRDLEQHLHRRFAHLRIRGEWFHFNEEVVQFLSTESKLEMPYAALSAGSTFLGLVGLGFSRSFYRAFAQDDTGQWWRFDASLRPVEYDPLAWQDAIPKERQAPTVRGRVSDAFGYECDPSQGALVRLLVRINELSAGESTHESTH